MKIQNQALAGVALALRFHPGQIATGDSFGTFDMPDEDAQFLLGTSGWRLFDPARQAQADAVTRQHEAAHEASRVHEATLQAQRVAQIAQETAAAAAATVVVADEKAAKLAYEAAKALELAPPAPEVPSPAASLAAGEPNLEAMDRAALITTAEGYGVGIDRRWSDQRIRETLHAALFDEETKG